MFCPVQFIPGGASSLSGAVKASIRVFCAAGKDHPERRAISTTNSGRGTLARVETACCCG